MFYYLSMKSLANIFSPWKCFFNTGTDKEWLSVFPNVKAWFIITEFNESDKGLLTRLPCDANIYTHASLWKYSA